MVTFYYSSCCPIEMIIKITTYFLYKLTRGSCILPFCSRNYKVYSYNYIVWDVLDCANIMNIIHWVIDSDTWWHQRGCLANWMTEINPLLFFLCDIEPITFSYTSHVVTSKRWSGKLNDCGQIRQYIIYCISCDIGPIIFSYSIMYT